MIPLRVRFAAACALALPFAACTGSGGAPDAPSDAGAADVAAPDVATPDAAATGDAGPTDPADLAPPPAGQGLQMKTDAFPVQPGQEVQSCYFFHVSDLAQAAGFPAGQPIDVHRIQVVQKAGSHHMNVFRVRTIKNLDPANGPVQTGINGSGPCFVSSNWSDWPLVTNTQQAGNQDWAYPDGVANELNAPDHPDEWLMLQTHYVNAGTQSTPGGVGQVAINLWTLPADQVTAQIGTLFATDQSIRVCQGNPQPTFKATCQFNSPTPVTIIGANGHFHSRGVEFDMFTWDGTSITNPPESARFYQSLTWDDPPMLHSPALNVPVPANGGVWYTCSYDWQPPTSAVGCSGLNSYDQTKYGTPAAQQDCCYTFGPQVDVNEHCNAFVYYYPKQDNVTCF
jgi:hypothetical protein